MNRLVRFLLILLTSITSAKSGIAQTITIVPPFTDTLLCVDTSQYYLNFQATGTYHSGNLFNVELSDNLGNFTGSMIIGSLNSSSNSGTVSYTIPGSISLAGLSASGYRIRIVSTNSIDSSTPTREIRITYPPALPIIPINSPYCEGSQISLQVNNSNPGVDYWWSGPAIDSIWGIGQKVKLSNLQFMSGSEYAGAYRVMAEYYGCTTTFTTQPIGIKPTPSKPTATSNSPVCEDDNLKFEGTSADAGITYGWEGSNIVASGQTLEIKNVKTARAGIYTLHAELNGCFSPKDTVEVIVLRKPSISIETNSPVCVGNEISINAKDDDNATIFNWSGPAGFTSTNGSNTIDTPSEYRSGTYTVIAMSQGCSDTAKVNVLVKPLPEKPVVATDSILACSMGNTLLSILNADTDSNTYHWTGPENFSAVGAEVTLQEVTLAHTGIYTITANKQACTLSDSLILTVKPTPVLDAKSNGPLVAGMQLQFSVNSSLANATYTWNGPNNFSSNLQNPVIENAQLNAVGKYLVTGNFDGCSSSDTVEVVIRPPYTPLILYPSPNNGNFTIRWTTFNNDKTVVLSIFNITGQRVYTTKATTENLLLNKSFSLGQLTPGVYILELDAGTGKFKRKFVVSR